MLLLVKWYKQILQNKLFYLTKNMSKPEFLSTNVAALLVYGRPPMVFAGMICAIGVMLDHNPLVLLQRSDFSDCRNDS
ncbi:MAG: hypothetical protein Ct9H300mP21_04320 [Pseudomonadota bacterium]|nr:MAG: hypothetical protein Ct9H300mP21_04320 [Pseudomonadota bacterium]